MRNHRRTALAAAPLSLALLLAGACSDDDSADDATTTTTTTEATTSTSETTTASTEPPATPTTATTAPPSTDTTAPPPSSETTTPPDGGAEEGLPTSPEEWASELIREWGVGDRERASQLAIPDVVRFLFNMADPGGSDWELDSCDGAAGTVRCTFRSASRGQTVVTSQSAPNGVLQPIHLVEQPPG